MALETVRKKLDSERQALLDLSNRNSLLNFRRQRSTGLQVIDSSVADVFERLAIDERKLSFLSDPEAEAQASDSDLLSKSVEIRSPTSRRPSKNRLQTPYSLSDLNRRLRRTNTRARESLEETGVNVLFMALGMLEWYEADSSHMKRNAPLILLPVTLDQTDVRGNFRIYYSDEDFGTNLSLREKLQIEFGIALPELPELDDIDVNAYFDEVESVVSGQFRWRVDQTAIELGFFSFTKYSMYRDLASDNWPDDHPVITALLGPDGFIENGSSSCEPEDLDREFKPGRPSVILDADSSQLLAIIEANAERSLVIQGPPGTGKSQTIANILAESIEQDKKVLFVSEKMAALEVVKRRMDAAGLGGACLELHSNKARKSAVIEDLKNAFELGEPELQDVNPTASAIATDRRRLNEYCSAVNTPVGNSGITPIYAYGRMMQIKSEHPDIAKHDLHLRGTESWDEETTSSKLRIVEELQAHLAEYGAPSRNPLHQSRASIQPLPTQFQELRSKERRFSGLINALEQDAKMIAANLHLPFPESIRDAQRLVKLCRLLLGAPNISAVDIESSAWEKQADLISYAIEKSKPSRDVEEISAIEAYARMKQIEGQFADIKKHTPQLRDAIPSSNATISPRGYRRRNRGLSMAELQTHAAGNPSSSKTRQPESITASSISANQFAKLHKCHTLLSDELYLIEHNSENLADDLRLPIPNTIDGVQYLIRICRLLLEAPDTSGFNISSTEWEDYNEELSNVIQKGKFVAQRLNDDPILSAIVGCEIGKLIHIKNSYEKYGGKIWSFLSSDYRAIQIEFRDIFNTSDKYSYKQSLYLLDEALHVKRAYDFLISSRYIVQNLVLGNYDPLKIDWQTMDSIHSYLQRLRAPKNAASLAISSEMLVTIAEHESILIEIEKSLVKLKNHYAAILSELKMNRSPSLSFAKMTSQTFAILEQIAHNLVSLVKHRLYRDILQISLDSNEYSEFHNKMTSLESVLIDVIDDYTGLLTVDWDSINDIHNYLAVLRSSKDAEHLVISPNVFKTAVNDRPRLENIEISIGSLERHYKDILSILALDHNDGLGFDKVAVCAWDDLRQSMSDWCNDLQSWRSIATYNRLAERLRQEGLQTVADCTWDWNRDATELVSLVEYRRYEDLIETALSERQPLAQFDRGGHERAIQRFRESDPNLLLATNQIVSHRHWNGIPRNSSYGEIGMLRNEMGKKRRIMPLRTLLEMAGRAVQAIKPIFMMSPLSVATYLAPGKVHFDMVVFDEASQVKPVDALGAILRAKSAVVVGDNRQLPPTSFFERISDESDDYLDASASDLESVLDLFVARGASQKTLRWHYRSQHQSLIAVSNLEFYQNQLLVAPSPDSSRNELGVQFRHLPDTHYQSGIAANLGEAREVAKAVMDHARRFPSLSLGVAAFSKSQSDLIEDEVDRLIRRDQSVDVSFFSDHPEEPFFVKNLENVQGDERDVIFISVGYGKQEDGRLAMRFGPLNQDGGERRLNVLITRAKRRCVVFSNITSGDIDISRTKATGVAALKTYLEFAETGRIDAAKPTGMTADSPFEESVTAALRAREYRVDEQVGAGPYRIDLAVVDENKPGRYLIGIECDGASYHSSKTARDRDRIRQETLEQRGWKIHRIWSTDWFYSPEQEMERLLRAIETAASESSSNVKQLNRPMLSSGDHAPMAPIKRKEVNHDTDDYLSVPYIMWKPQEEQAYIHMTHKHWYYSESESVVIDQMMVEIVRTESPVHILEVRRRISAAMGVSMRNLREDWIHFLAEESGDIRIESDFMYTSEPPRAIKVRDRSQLPQQSRRIDFVAPEEIRQAVHNAIASSFRIGTDELPKAVSKMLGFVNTTQSIRTRVSEQLVPMKQQGRIAESDGMLELSGKSL